MPIVNAAKGLEGNPAITGEVFTDKATYFQAAKPEVEKTAYKTARNEALKTVVKKFKNKTVAKDSADGGINIGFNRKGLEHVQHDYFPNRWIRDVFLQNMDKIVERSKYVGQAPERKGNIMVEKYYYYEIVLLKKPWYLNIRKLKNGELYVYSMTDKIKKE